VTARIVDGKAMGQRIRDDVRAEVSELLAAGGPVPGLGVILVGDDPASQVYVRNKTRACAEAGIYSEQADLPQTASEQEVLAQVARFNTGDAIHGILVQLPLPDQIDKATVISAIDPAKDVDGLHPINAGWLAMGLPRIVPATPAGVMECLRREDVAIAGKRAVVVGRSALVGRPVAQLLLLANATVTICHTGTRDLAAITREADILVVAAGRPALVTAAMVKPGATVVDVGLSRTPTGDDGGAPRMVGDCAPDVAEVAGLLTPVPGGIGPLTIAMLLVNTVAAARRAPARAPTG